MWPLLSRIGAAIDRAAARRIVAEMLRTRASLTSLPDLSARSVDPEVVLALEDIATRLSVDAESVLRVFVELLIEVAGSPSDERQVVLGLVPARPSAYAGRGGRVVRHAVRDAVF